MIFLNDCWESMLAQRERHGTSVVFNCRDLHRLLVKSPQGSCLIQNNDVLGGALSKQPAQRLPKKIMDIL